VRRVEYMCKGPYNKCWAFDPFESIDGKLVMPLKDKVYFTTWHRLEVSIVKVGKT